MRREHKPIYLKHAKAALDARLARHFLHPHFDAVGEGCAFDNPLCVHAFGGPIVLGRHVKVSAMRENPVRFAVWGAKPGLGRISVGDYSVINPGARISSGHSITIEKNALFASNVCITDTDWHGRYDRVHDTGGSAPIVIEENVWLGEGVIVTKGVTIGRNSIVGAGSVVVKDIPANSVAAGVPARVISELDPEASFYSRSNIYEHPQTEEYFAELRRVEKEMLAGNTLLGYLRYLLFPKRSD